MVQGLRGGGGMGMHEARGLEHRLGSRGSGVCFVDMRQLQAGRSRSAALAGIERLNSGGSEQRLYRGQRSDGAPLVGFKDVIHRSAICLHCSTCSCLLAVQQACNRPRHNRYGQQMLKPTL